MKYTVYHALQPNFGFGERKSFPNDYAKIAVVECEDIEDVFRATNHIDTNWMENKEVIECFVDIARSTSVGDVVVDENGNKYHCEFAGWKQI